MSVSTSTSSISYAGNASTVTAYPVPFVFNYTSDLQVYEVTSGISSLLNLGTDYTVSGGSGSTGSIVTAAAVPSTSTITIVRSVPYTQLTSLTTGDRLPAKTLEQALDNLTYQTQQLSRKSSPDTIAATGVGPFVLSATQAGGTQQWVATNDLGYNQWITQTSNYTALNGDRISADTTSGAFTITLPSPASFGSIVTILDGGSYWSTNNLTVQPNSGQTIEGGTVPLTCNIGNKYVILFFNGTTWRVLT